MSSLSMMKATPFKVGPLPRQPPPPSPAPPPERHLFRSAYRGLATATLPRRGGFPPLPIDPRPVSPRAARPSRRSDGRPTGGFRPLARCWSLKIAPPGLDRAQPGTVPPARGLGLHLHFSQRFPVYPHRSPLNTVFVPSYRHLRRPKRLQRAPVGRYGCRSPGRFGRWQAPGKTSRAAFPTRMPFYSD